MAQLRRFLIDPSCVFAEQMGDLQRMRDVYDVTGNPTVSKQSDGEHLEFDATNDFIQIAEAGDGRFDLTDHTIACSLNVDDLSAKYVFAKRGTGQGINLLIDNLAIAIVDGAPGVEPTGQSLTAGVNAHVVITVSGTTLYSYLNGAPSSPVTITAFTGNVVDIPFIGQRTTGAGRYGGGIGYLIVWNRALSAKEALNLATGRFF